MTFAPLKHLIGQEMQCAVNNMRRAMSYESEIIRALSRLGMNGTANPDTKHNSGRLLGEAFLWDRVAKYAEAKSDAVWKQLSSEGIIPDKASLGEGDHELAASPSFLAIAKVTKPIKRFSGDELADLLARSKYKVPVSTTKELIDQAKIDGKPARSLRIIERG